MLLSFNLGIVRKVFTAVNAFSNFPAAAKEIE